MLQISTETPLTFPFLFETGEPEPPDTGDQPPPTEIKPPTNQQQGNVGGDSGIKPPTATDTPDAEPPDTNADNDPPIVVSGGGGGNS
jgi:hypothetical protein